MRRDEGTPATAMRRRRATLGLVATALAAAIAAGGARAEEYRLQAGDVVEMSVAGLPDMNARAAVQIDGSLSFPLVGAVAAAGLSVAETRDRIQTALASRLLPVYLPDGREATRMVDRDEISASVVEYRPVFVSGDVARPGELAFRPGMTARQAVAAAGGVIPAAPLAPGYDAIGLRADYAGAWQAAAVAAARVWRLRQELGEDAGFDVRAWPAAPGPGDALQEILRVETDLRDARARNHGREREFLARTVAQIDGQTGILQRQLEVETGSEKVDADALAAAMDVTAKNGYTEARLADFRAAALISSTRRLQTETTLMQLERRRMEVARELERLDEDRRPNLLSELQEARVVEARERARLGGADEKLRAAGLAPSSAGVAGPPEISIIRGGAERPGPTIYDSEIRPGDVVEVIRRMEAPPFTVGASPGGGQHMQTAAAIR